MPPCWTTLHRDSVGENYENNFGIGAVDYCGSFTTRRQFSRRESEDGLFSARSIRLKHQEGRLLSWHSQIRTTLYPNARSLRVTLLSLLRFRPILALQ